MLDAGPLLWGVVLALHLLGVVAWVGGMLFTLAILRPSLMLLDSPQRLAVHTETLRRFLRMVLHVMPVVLLSGWAMLFGFYNGFSEGSWTIQTMHLLGLLMAGVFLLIYFGPWKAMRRTGGPELLHSIRHLVTLNLGLGLLTIVVAALGHFG